ncbi:unnamed protein product, partial [Choristocarpus tenellus]
MGNPFVLLTDPYALKHLIMNHQVWGLGDRRLMIEILRLLHRLVSPHNAKSHCRFNGRILHRIGVFRWGLHLVLEAAEPTLPVICNITDCGDDARGVAVAGFGGETRPAADVAAAGLDRRDDFMVACVLLMQRVLACCAIQRDFDRVVGATLSTLADGGSREERAKGRGGNHGYGKGRLEDGADTLSE